MLINKHNIACAECASTDETRPALTGVNITENYTEATNGHIFLRVGLPKVDLADFPTIAGFTPAPPKTNESAIVEAKAFKAISNQIGRSKTLPILNFAAVNASGDIRTRGNTTQVAIATTDLDTDKITNILAIEGPYPKTEQIYPTKESHQHQTIIVSIEALSQLVGALKKALPVNNDGAQFLRLHIDKNPAVAIAFTGETTKDGQEISGLIMPCRDKNCNWSTLPTTGI